MPAVNEYPEVLQQLELARIRVQLEYQQDTLLPAGYGLRLRRELRPLAQQLLAADAYATLFASPLPSDPVLLRSVQRPAPGFALQPCLTAQETRICEGDEEWLQLNLFGPVCGLLPQFIEVLIALGRVGICHGNGRFELLSVASADLQGDWQVIWQSGRSPATIAPQIWTAASWLDSRPELPDPLRLQWHTPLRLIRSGRPLFRPNFVDFLPFLLRRVTALAVYGSGLAWSDELTELLQAARALQSDGRGLRWADWRELERAAERVELGGVLGTLKVTGEALTRLAWLLYLGTLTNVGKGAAYGAGQYTLEGPR